MNNQQAKIQRVPSLLLKDKRNKEDYTPKVVSIGPYYHGKAELDLVESFKLTALDLFLDGGEEGLSFYHEKILEVISDVRNCYDDQESTKKYEDHDLARMMLLDACLILNHIIIQLHASDVGAPFFADTKFKCMHERLGFLTMALLPRDFFLLDNQIPLRIIKLLIGQRYKKNEGKELLNRYLNVTLFGKEEPEGGRALGKEDEPLHLLDAFRFLVIFEDEKAEPSKKKKKMRKPNPQKKNKDEKTDVETDPFTDPEIGPDSATQADKADKRSTIKEKKQREDRTNYYHSFRSVTDLKAKGIYFKPSPIGSWMDVKFTSYFLWAKLELPVSFISIHTKVYFLNLIAYELSPTIVTYGEVTAYINLMKSLIERPEDVKELRENRILINTLGSDEEVLNVYKEINTYGGASRKIFQKEKNNIQSHSDSKIRTCIAELIHTYFRSPWTFLSLLAAITLLCLTSIQTRYAMHP